MRLIDADAIVKQMKENYCDGCDSHNGLFCRACVHLDAMYFVEDAPTIEAEPVKCGVWLTHGDTAICSVCGQWCNQRALTYCANCGAKMRGSEQNA